MKLILIVLTFLFSFSLIAASHLNVYAKVKAFSDKTISLEVNGNTIEVSKSEVPAHYRDNISQFSNKYIKLYIPLNKGLRKYLEKTR